MLPGRFLSDTGAPCPFLTAAPPGIMLQHLLRENSIVGFYSRYVLPKVVHYLCSHKSITRQRRKLVPLAKGRVLEIGAGSGLNLPFYDAGRVRHVWGLEPRAEMWAMAQTGGWGFGVEFIEASAETIPLADGSADTIVVTYTLCSIDHVVEALLEMRRVLRPGGELLFCEHGVARHETVRRWQARLNPLWGKLADGCQLNRPIPRLLEKGGFEIRSMQSAFIGRPRIATFNYWGRAV
jgi:ubiquinone/menaquinone biosynthesis C-methylase UbiE